MLRILLIALVLIPTVPVLADPPDEPADNPYEFCQKINKQALGRGFGDYMDRRVLAEICKANNLRIRARREQELPSMRSCAGARNFLLHEYKERFPRTGIQQAESECGSSVLEATD